MADQEEDELEIGVGAEGGKIKAKGGGASRLIHAAADIISPASEGLGAIGDAIRQFRIHRELAASIALERAKQIKQERGEEVTPISTKMLSVWIEGASAEDPADKDNIMELWARILASSPEKFDSTYAIFTDILKHIGKDEADTIDTVRKTVEGSSLKPGQIKYNNDSDLLKFIDESELPNDRDYGAGRHRDEINKVINGMPPLIGALIQRVVFQGNDAGSLYDIQPAAKAPAVSNLVREGVMERISLTNAKPGVRVTIEYVETTPLGLALIRALYPVEKA